MKWTAISYYTIGTGYEQEVLKLKASFDRLGIARIIEGYKPRGSWQKNTQIKAEFILEVMRHVVDTAVVFIDADAIVHQYPGFFDTLDCDLGLAYRDYALFPCGTRKSGKELLSGTIYFANNEIVRQVVREWIRLNELNPATWEQRNLQTAVEGMRDKLQIIELPPTYCKIFDSMRMAGPGVIEHYQKSRKYRSQVGNQPIMMRPRLIKGILRTNAIR